MAIKTVRKIDSRQVMIECDNKYYVVSESLPRWGAIALTKNKTLSYELNFGREADINSFFKLYFNITRNTDHAGTEFEFAIFNLFWISISFNDNRHWNYEEQRWETYEDKNV